MTTQFTPGPWKVNATPHSSNQDYVVLDSGANGHSKRVSSGRVDRAVLAQVQADLTGRETIERIAKSMQGVGVPDSAGKRIPSIEKRIGVLSTKINRLIDLAATVDDATPYLRRVAEMEAERAGLLAEIEQIKTGLAQADAGRNFGHAEIRAMLDALWRDMAERTGVLEIREALREMIDRVELEPEATTVRIVYRIPVASTDAETTGVSLASPRQADTTPVAEWVSEGTLDRKWKVYAARK